VVVRVPPVLEVVFDGIVEFDDNDPVVAAIGCQLHTSKRLNCLVKSLDFNIPAQVSSRYFTAVARSVAWHALAAQDTAFDLAVVSRQRQVVFD
jgi:hypothetical protein